MDKERSPMADRRRRDKRIRLWVAAAVVAWAHNPSGGAGPGQAEKKDGGLKKTAALDSLGSAPTDGAPPGAGQKPTDSADATTS
jgi:hypothetical protein